MKICVDCKQSQPLENFHLDGRGSRKPYCKPCRAVRRKAQSNGRVGREAERRAHLKARYGITVEDYDKMLAFQEGGCGICQTKTEPLNVDHCHTVGTFRGLLCKPCNVGLGFFRDNPEHLRAAANYLEF